MKLSAQMTLVIAIIFAALCFAYAIYGWMSLGDMPMGPQRDEAWGYVGYWAFLGAVGVAGAFVSWRMTRHGED